MSFNGKVVIVTGASSGIGAAAAIKFAEAGASVVINGRNETKLKNVLGQCNNFGDRHLVVKGDVSFEAEADRLVNETLKKYGKIDVLVNNAGIIRTCSVLEGKFLETYDEIMGTNLRPVVQLTALTAPYLVKTRGNIVNISSIAGRKAMKPSPAYCTSKAGLDQFSRAVALDLAGHGVRVNVISPGPVKTDIAENSGISLDAFIESGVDLETPLKRISQPEEVADLILFLASDKAVGVTGSNYDIDNGKLLQ